jgi:hypothetical protein
MTNNSGDIRRKWKMAGTARFCTEFADKTQYLYTFQRFFAGDSCRGIRKNYICIEFG